MERDAPAAKVDLLVSLAGPAVSAGARRGRASPPRWRCRTAACCNQLAFQLALSNLIVAVFNALPGLPLDGGRALRAVVWAVTGDRHTGTEVAGWVGRGRRRRHASLLVALLDRRPVPVAVRPGLHAAGRAHPVAGRRPGDPAGPDQPPAAR